MQLDQDEAHFAATQRKRAEFMRCLEVNGLCSCSLSMLIGTLRKVIPSAARRAQARLASAAAWSRRRGAAVGLAPPTPDSPAHFIVNHRYLTMATRRRRAGSGRAASPRPRRARSCRAPRRLRLRRRLARCAPPARLARRRIRSCGPSWLCCGRRRAGTQLSSRALSTSAPSAPSSRTRSCAQTCPSAC
ncbi:hypothetical protein T492DRAFT_922462 [Pavlovales sp. CCMP2436]|nr:hypothetical protein T492DRAFT_922462 [Pavlovales sp. CCMP2436]